METKNKIRKTRLHENHTLGKRIGHFTYNIIISWIIVFIITIYPMIFSLKLPERFYLPKYIALLLISALLLAMNLLFRISLINVEVFKKNKWIYSLLFIYMIFTALSAVFALDKEIAFRGTYEKLEGSFTILIYIMLFIYTLQWYEYNNVHFKIFTLTSSLICIYGILQKINLDFLPIYEYRSMEQLMYSTIGNPNSLGAFINLSLFIVCFYAIKENNIIYYLCSVIHFLALLCTQSMASWLGGACGYILMVYLIHKTKNKKYIKNVIILSLVLISIILLYEIMFNTFLPELSVFKDDVIKMFIKDNISAGRYRKYAWKISLVLIFSSPIIGYGPECMNLGIKALNMGNYDYFASNLNRAHNEYLNTMVSSGVFAGLAQVLLIITTLIKGIRSREFNYKLALTSSVMAYFVQANFSSSIISVIPIFWIFMAIILKE